MDFIGLAPQHFDTALGAVLAEAMNAHGWTARKVAVFARLRPRMVKRILSGKTSAGTVELYRLLRVLQLPYDATLRAAYVDAQVAQLAASTRAAEQQARIEGTIG